MNEKLKELSKKIVNYSLDIKENDKVLIKIQSLNCRDLVKYLVRDIVDKRAIPFVKIVDLDINSLLLELTTDYRIEEIKKQDKFEVDNYDCFINIKYSTNDYESSKINSEIRKKIGVATKDIDSIRINQKRWVLLNYPSVLDAYKANMKTDDFYKFSIDAMTIDYNKMYEDIKPLKQLLEKTDKVRIVAPNTDLTFSIKDMPIIPCCGKCNIPDGEIYTAPIKDSVNGKITYNTRSPYNGYVFSNVSLTFKDGKIIKSTSELNNDKLSEIFDTDEGARYIGEFSIGLNPFIKDPIGDILYDEKIKGSIHFTPGQAYHDAYNKNDSSIHWDLVLIENKEYGGGELYFDNVLVRKDGIFVIDSLKHLNYENNWM